MRAIAFAFAVGLAACQQTLPAICPGTKVASFTFSVDGGVSSCPFAGSEQLDFSGTLAWDPDGGAAAFCLDRPRSVPHLGSHVGDHVTAQVDFDGVDISSCSCLSHVVETLEGDVVRDAQSVPVGFLGVLTDAASPSLQFPPGPGVAADCGCGLPCAVSYALDGGT